MNIANSPVKLSLRRVDLILTHAVISNLAELSGSDIEVIGGLLDALGDLSPEDAKIGFKPEQRADPAYQVEKEYTLTAGQVHFLLTSIYGQVKAFTARDIKQVREVRARLNKAIEGLEATSAGTEVESKEDNSAEE